MYYISFKAKRLLYERQWYPCFIKIAFTNFEENLNTPAFTVDSDDFILS